MKKIIDVIEIRNKSEILENEEKNRNKVDKPKAIPGFDEYLKQASYVCCCDTIMCYLFRNPQKETKEIIVKQKNIKKNGDEWYKVFLLCEECGNTKKQLKRDDYNLDNLPLWEKEKREKEKWEKLDCLWTKIFNEPPPKRDHDLRKRITGERNGWQEYYESQKAKTQYYCDRNSLYKEYLWYCPYWRDFSNQKLLDHPYCKCGAKATQCHHLTYEHIFYEQEYPDDVITVCKKCHPKADKERRSCKITFVGDEII